MTDALQVLAAVALVSAAAWAIWRTKWGYPDGSVPAVLAYHKIARFELGGTWISARRFERHIRSLLDSGYTFISENEFLDALEGRREPSRGEILLTFDDGYESFAIEAAPVLERLSVPALVFLLPGFAGRENDWELGLPGRKARHMDWDTVRGLLGKGFSFGSHGMSHRPMTRMSRDEALAELVSSREEIERNTCARVSSFSYPFGRTSPEIARLAEEAGYGAAFTLYPGGRASGRDRFRLRREGAWVIDTPATLRSKLSRSRFFWLEDIKGRAINAAAELSIIMKR